MGLAPLPPAWSATEHYGLYSQVSYGGIGYISSVSSPTYGVIPPSNSEWEVATASVIPANPTQAYENGLPSSTGILEVLGFGGLGTSGFGGAGYSTSYKLGSAGNISLCHVDYNPSIPPVYPSPSNIYEEIVNALVCFNTGWFYGGGWPPTFFPATFDNELAKQILSVTCFGARGYGFLLTTEQQNDPAYFGAPPTYSSTLVGSSPFGLGGEQVLQRTDLAGNDLLPPITSLEQVFSPAAMDIINAGEAISWSALYDFDTYFGQSDTNGNLIFPYYQALNAPGGIGNNTFIIGEQMYDLAPNSNYGAGELGTFSAYQLLPLGADGAPEWTGIVPLMQDPVTEVNDIGQFINGYVIDHFDYDEDGNASVNPISIVDLGVFLGPSVVTNDGLPLVGIPMNGTSASTGVTTSGTTNGGGKAVATASYQGPDIIVGNDINGDPVTMKTGRLVSLNGLPTDLIYVGQISSKVTIGNANGTTPTSPQQFSIKSWTFGNEIDQATFPDGYIYGNVTALRMPCGSSVADTTTPAQVPAGFLAQCVSIANPTIAPTLGSYGAVSDFAAGTYQVAYSYTTDLGETLISPTTSITITSNESIQVSIISPIPSSATGINYYISNVAGSSFLTRAIAVTSEIGLSHPYLYGTEAIDVPSSNTSGVGLAAVFEPLLATDKYKVFFANADIVVGLNPEATDLDVYTAGSDDGDYLVRSYQAEPPVFGGSSSGYTNPYAPPILVGETITTSTQGTVDDIGAALITTADSPYALAPPAGPAPAYGAMWEVRPKSDADSYSRGLWANTIAIAYAPAHAGEGDRSGGWFGNNGALDLPLIPPVGSSTEVIFVIFPTALPGPNNLYYWPVTIYKDRLIRVQLAMPSSAGFYPSGTGWTQQLVLLYKSGSKIYGRQFILYSSDTNLPASYLYPHVLAGSSNIFDMPEWGSPSQLPSGSTWAICTVSGTSLTPVATNAAPDGITPATLVMPFDSKSNFPNIDLPNFKLLQIGLYTGNGTNTTSEEGAPATQSVDIVKGKTGGGAIVALSASGALQASPSSDDFMTIEAPFSLGTVSTQFGCAKLDENEQLLTGDGVAQSQILKAATQSSNPVGTLLKMPSGAIYAVSRSDTYEIKTIAGVPNQGDAVTFLSGLQMYAPFTYCWIGSLLIFATTTNLKSTANLGVSVTDITKQGWTGHNYRPVYDKNSGIGILLFTQAPPDTSSGLVILQGLITRDMFDTYEPIDLAPDDGDGTVDGNSTAGSINPSIDGGSGWASPPGIASIPDQIVGATLNMQRLVIAYADASGTIQTIYRTVILDSDSVVDGGSFTS